MVTCMDVNNLKLDGMELVAGESGLKRMVSWTYLVQTRPYEDHMNRGNFALIVVDYIRFDFKEVRKSMDELNDLGISGLAVSVVDDKEPIPKSIIKRANELCLPLFNVRWKGASFVDISQSIGNLILETNIMNKRTGDYLYNGGTEISASQIRREHYTLVVPSSAELKTENVDFTEIDSMKNQGLKAYFLELREGYAVTVNDQLIAFESENGTGIRIIPPSESISLPSVTFQDAEAVFAYKKSTCSIILENAECTQQFVLLKNGEKIGFESLRRTDNELVFIFPFDGELFLKVYSLSLIELELLFFS